jgi:hypothetical protein
MPDVRLAQAVEDDFDRRPVLRRLEARLVEGEGPAPAQGQQAEAGRPEVAGLHPAGEAVAGVRPERHLLRDPAVAGGAGLRLVAVADVFDALTSTRPYKAAWGNDEAFATLRQLAGVKLDRDCVEALLGARAEVEEIQKHFREDPYG